MTDANATPNRGWMDLTVREVMALEPTERAAVMAALVAAICLKVQP